MDFQQLLSVASNKQKVKEKELATTKKGVNMNSTTKTNSVKKKVDEEKQKKLDAIRARVEAQFKPKDQETKPKSDAAIMDFTITGLSENDIRRKKLSEAEKAKKQQEFLEKLKRLKERPVGSEENEQVKVKVHRSSKESSINGENNKHKTSSKVHEKDGKKPAEAINNGTKSDKHHKHKHKSHKHHKEKHHSSTKDKDDKPKSEHSVTSKPEWVSLKKEKPVPAPAPAPAKKKPPPKGPPPLSFTELLSMAQENKNKPVDILKQTEPASTAGKAEKVTKKKIREPDRPMTQEEKERFYRMQTPEYRRWLKYGGPRPSSVPSSVKRKGSGVKSRETIQDTQSDSDDDEATAKCSQTGAKISQASAKLKHSSASRPSQQEKTTSSDASCKIQKPSSIHSGKSIRDHKGKHSSSQPVASDKHSASIQKKGQDLMNKPTKEVTKEKVKMETQNPWDRIYSQIKQQNPKKEKRSRRDVIESDDEYDDDLDGFIVDGDEEMDDFIDDSEAQDYSKYISEIFGYDKRKYRDLDDDDLSDMETGFAEQMKEEIRSAKIGLMEDLEDIKMEEEMKKRKMKKKVRIH